MRLTTRVNLGREAGDGVGGRAGGASYKGSQSRKKRSIVGMTRRCGNAGNKEEKK